MTSSDYVNIFLLLTFRKYFLTQIMRKMMADRSPPYRVKWDVGPLASCFYFFFFLRPRVPCLYSWMQVTAAILQGVELS